MYAAFRLYNVGLCEYSAGCIAYIGPGKICKILLRFLEKQLPNKIRSKWNNFIVQSILWKLKSKACSSEKILIKRICTKSVRHWISVRLFLFASTCIRSILLWHIVILYWEFIKGALFATQSIALYVRL